MEKVTPMKKLLLLGLTLSLLSSNQDNLMIKINKNISSVTVEDSGQKINIRRVQDPRHRLTDDYTKTSRACPPFCIQSTKIDPSVETIAELELLEFMQKKISTNKGLLIDARLKSWFELETIPSAINLPFPILLNSNKQRTERIFRLLGMKVNSDGSWDFKNVKDLTVFDNGVWCSQASHLVSGLLKYNYPSSKIHYYRSGLQGWKLFGLTTVVRKEIIKG